MDIDEPEHRPSAAVGSSGRRALRDLRFLFAVACVMLVGVVVAVLAHPEPGTDVDGLDAAAAALADTQVADAHLLLLFYQWMSQEDLASGPANELATEAALVRGRAVQAWERFLDVAPDAPGDDALIERYQQSVEAGEEWTDQLLSEPSLAGPDGPSHRARTAVVSSSMGDARARIEVLSDLRSRYSDAQTAAVLAERASVDLLSRNVTIAVGSGVGFLLLGFVPLHRWSRRRAAALEHVDALLQAEGVRTSLEGQLNRALEMTDEEGSAYRVLETALGEVLGGTAASELLVADASFAHLARVARSEDPEVVGCDVTTPAECPAVRRGHTQHFPSPTALDACPRLRDRDADVATTCVPFTVGGTSVGVLHVEARAALPAESVTLVELVARKTGDRVGVARAFAKSEDQARTDPLTGLLNRRSLEERGRQVAESGQPFTVVFADLDHFKTLNDVHGHDAGDRALRLFARALREAVRPTDLIGRYGGEEFVVVLPHCDVEGATAVIERLRGCVERSLDTGSVPRFTSSFGMVECTGGPLSDAIARADAALLDAKRAGRNRSIAWTPELGTGRLEEAVGSGEDGGAAVAAATTPPGPEASAPTS